MKRYRGKNHKVTEEMKKQMTLLRSQGLSFNKIGAKLGISGATVQYHLNPRQKELNYKRQEKAWQDGRTWEQKNPKKRRKYQREYMKERYNNDPEFCERHKRHMREYQDRLKGDKEDGE